METTDAFRARFEENFYQLLLKKGIDPATARARAKAKAAALPARIETPAAAPAPAPVARTAPDAGPSRHARGARATGRPRLHVSVGPSRPVLRARAYLRLLCWPVWKSRYRRDVVPAAARWREVDDFHQGTGNFAACRATAHNCNCTTMISLLSSTAIPCRAHVHRCRCDNPSHKCLSRVHKCICGTVLGKCLKHPQS